MKPGPAVELRLNFGMAAQATGSHVFFGVAFFAVRNKGRAGDGGVRFREFPRRGAGERHIDRQGQDHQDAEDERGFGMAPDHGWRFKIQRFPIRAATAM